MPQYTPMMQQYLETKKEYKDCILFYRLGDFYEMFFDDAVTASRELELTLTGKDCGQEERAPMCGVPYHAVESYLNRLISKGYKVAICEQVEDPKTAKGIVKREVIRVVTPELANIIDGCCTDRLILKNMAHNCRKTATMFDISISRTIMKEIYNDIDKRTKHNRYK